MDLLASGMAHAGFRHLVPGDDNDDADDDNDKDTDNDNDNDYRSDDDDDDDDVGYLLMLLEWL